MGISIASEREFICEVSAACDSTASGAQCYLVTFHRLHRRDQEDNGDDHLADTDAALPPLGVKLTGYRLLNMTTVFSFGIIKAILTYMGQSTAPTTLDWVSGALLAGV